MTHDPDEDEGDDFYNAAHGFLTTATQHLPPEHNPTTDNPDTTCPTCESTNTHTEEEPLRKWVLDATCRNCGHQWKASGD